MATPSNALPAEQRPIQNCGICSSPLCSHHVCRVCSQCAECDAIHLHSAPAGSRFLVDVLTDRKSAAQARRIDYLRGCGIAEEDFAEASRAVDNLKSDCCRPGHCNRRKRTGQSFCGWCFTKLPAELQANLGLHLRGGYLGHYRQALQILTGIDRYESLAGQQVKPTP
jgi:hypothetical protein